MGFAQVTLTKPKMAFCAPKRNAEAVLQFLHSERAPRMRFIPKYGVLHGVRESTSMRESLKANSLAVLYFAFGNKKTVNKRLSSRIFA
jgi:hypothetical protein